MIPTPNYQACNKNIFQWQYFKLIKKTQFRDNEMSEIEHMREIRKNYERHGNNFNNLFKKLIEIIPLFFIRLLRI